MEQKGYQRIELIPLLALIRDHNGDSTVYLYDGNGNLVSKTDADGYVTRYSYTYDAVGNQTGITYPDGSKTRSFYDAVYNLTSVIDADDGTYAYVYDVANRPVKLTYGGVY